ncbi:MAG: aldo/keto reductase [Candidatus Nanopelagicales bacterium]
MEHRAFERLGRSASVIGLGCWQLGADWGDVDDATAMAILHAAADAGVTFFDTADVYGDGRSERFVGQLLRERAGEQLFVATKTGRRATAQVDQEYSEEHLRAWIARSLENLGVDRLDLVQWHCPPTDTIARESMYELFDELTAEGLIAGYGVSVETVEQARLAIAHPHIASLQIIANAFRLKPLETVVPEAAAQGVGVIVRVPLASGLLSAKFRSDTEFAADDHRAYNRQGEAFDVGETFAGVPYEVGVAAAQELADCLPDDITPAQAALRWLVDQLGVTTVIPGASSVAQAQANAAVGSLPRMGDAYRGAVRRIYDSQIRHFVHARW